MLRLHNLSHFLYDTFVITVIIVQRDATQSSLFIIIKVSNRQHVSTNQVAIIRSITEIYIIAEGCAHIWDPISVYKWACPLVLVYYLLYRKLNVTTS